MARRRDNLIAFRTTEGTKLEEVHQRAKAEGESIKAILESWAVVMAENAREENQ